MTAKRVIERIDRLTEPPIVGRWYLVPALTYDRFHKGELSWPIIGPKHNDVEFFGFEPQHYHLDTRFLTRRHLRQIGNNLVVFGLGLFAAALSQPCSQGRWSVPLPKPSLVRMKCLRNAVEYPFADRGPVQEINKKHQGETAQRSKRGWVCPHRKVPLGNQVPDDRGIITCPLHGLRIDAATGKCVGPLS